MFVIFIPLLWTDISTVTIVSLSSSKYQLVHSVFASCASTIVYVKKICFVFVWLVSFIVCWFVCFSVSGS